MSNYGYGPTVGDIEAAVSVLKAEAHRQSPMGTDFERMNSLMRVVEALEALLPRSQTVNLQQLRPRA